MFGYMSLYQSEITKWLELCILEKYVDQFIGTEGKLDYLRSQKKKKKKTEGKNFDSNIWVDSKPSHLFYMTSVEFNAWICWMQ